MITLAVSSENIYLFDRYEEFKRFVQRALVNNDTGAPSEVLECWVENDTTPFEDESTPDFTVKDINFDEDCRTATIVVLDEDDKPCRYCYNRWGIFNRDILPL